MGAQAVSASGSGLLTGSFSEVFDSQAIEDSEFLGRIQQRANQDITNLRAQAKSTLIAGAFSTVSQLAGGIGSARAGSQATAAAETQRRSILRANPGGRLRPRAQPFFGPNRRSRGTTQEFRGVL